RHEDETECGPSYGRPAFYDLNQMRKPNGEREAGARESSTVLTHFFVKLSFAAPNNFCRSLPVIGGLSIGSTCGPSKFFWRRLVIGRFDRRHGQPECRA